MTTPTVAYVSSAWVYETGLVVGGEHPPTQKAQGRAIIVHSILTTL